MNFKKDYDGEAKAIITDAFVFTDFKPGELPDMKFFTHVAAWDTGAEHTSLSMEVIEALQLKPVGYDTIAVFGGVEKAGLYQVSIGLPNATIMHNMIVYGADLDEYSMLIGMDVIRKTDFLITNKDGKTNVSLYDEQWEIARHYPFVEKDAQKRTCAKALVMTHAYSNAIIDKVEEALKNGIVGNEDDD